MRSLAPRFSAILRPALVGSVVLSGSLAGGCGSPPPAAPVAAAPSPPIPAAQKERAVDTSPVPEPPGLVLVARVAKPDAIVSAVGSWTHLPLPSGSDLVRAIADDSVADVVDLGQPVDAAMTVGLSRRGVDARVAFAVAVRSFDEAKTKLGARHRLVQGDNGSFRVEGLGKKSSASRSNPSDGHARRGEEEDDDEDDGEGCVLAPGAISGRLVCGEAAALATLVPYLSRTLPREKWSSDIHVEIRPEPVRGPLTDLRSTIPILARSVLGSQSSAVRQLVDASIGEVIDIASDAQKLSLDAQIDDAGAVISTRFDFQSKASTFAKLLTTDRGDATPASFWHLPADTDTAFFGRGSDPKLFERPRELVANLLVEATAASGMPDAEQQAVRDLVAERTLALFAGGTGIYAKGFDQAALEKAVNARKGVKWEDQVGRAEAKRAVVEQVVGWHLYQVSEPMAKVGPLLKDWSALWNRPSFAKWAEAKAAGGPLPRMRVVVPPAGVPLPKGTVHLEVAIPRDDVEVPPTAKVPKAKKVPLKPVLFHVFAVPDGGATWLAFGLDPKLVAQKAAASLASAPETNTLGKSGAGYEALRDDKLSSGGLFTLRGLAVFAAFDEGDRSPFGLLGALPHKGAAPIVFTGRAEAASAAAKAGASVGSARIARAVIEDIVKLAMSAR